ncbi:hypothetical protein [Treponema endosymbiont of Eucomonympha sp.]|uniref:hypothetical protein n=1 Tax=Treponema endosymbiont of Eucomonympha sp. TaxID=1580831 RepID=UPI000783DE85|nr:hypothetical protein [Treponema endosymbiont of Eucomonympha sp.]
MRKLSLFPAAGFDYQIFTKATQNGNTVKRAELPDKDAADYVIIKAGLGAELMLTDAVFIRGYFLYGFFLNNKSDRDAILTMPALDYEFKGFSHGPSARIAAGYRFGIL